MFLGIDIGTGSTKAVLTDSRGTILESASRSHRISLPRPGWAEFDALGVGWPEVQSLCRELLVRRDPSELRGVGISAMGPCVLVTDGAKQPLRPTILYGIDSRAHDEIEELNAELGEGAIFATCGKALSSQAGGPKLRWLSRREPDVFARASRFYSLSSWVVDMLCGAYVLDHHTASQFDPLYDLQRHTWHDEWMPAVTRHLERPSLAWPSDIAGTVTAEAAAATGIPQGTPVCAGTVDAWAEAHSAGVRRPGDLMLMYGSTMFFVEVLSRFRSHEKMWTTAGVDTGSLTMAAGMSTSGSLTTWIQGLTGDAPFEQLVVEAESTPAGADGLVLLPYFAGERTPIFDPDARGLINGLTLTHTRGHLLRAAYEGIACGIRQILAFLDETGEPVRRLIAVGGGTQSRLWLQIVSDVTGRDQVVPERTIGASYGDALMAAVGTGAVPSDTSWAAESEVITPKAEHAEVYDELFALYEQSYASNRDHMHRLAALQKV